MHSYRRVAAVVIAAGLLATAGCWNPAPEKYPSITFFGANYGTITEGGSVTLKWQTRLAEKVNITATPASGGSSTIVATFKSGDPTGTNGCTVNPDFPDSDCVKDGTLSVSPTEDTIYNIQAIVGAGNCDRDPVLGNLLHPTQCNDLTADPNASLTVIPVGVVPASSVTLTVGGSDSTTVTSGTDVTADYTTTNASAFDFGVLGQDAQGNPTYDACGAPGDNTVPCNYTAASIDGNGNLLASGQILVPGVTDTTVLTGESTNGADDGAGDVAPGTAGSTVTINVSAANPTPTIDTWTVNGTDALTATNNTVAIGSGGTNPPNLVWTTTNAGSYDLQMTALGGAADCTAATGYASVDSSSSAGDGSYTPTANITAATCFQLTVTASTGTNTAMQTIEVDP